MTSGTSRLLDALKNPQLLATFEISTDRSVQQVRADMEAAVKPAQLACTPSDAPALFEGDISESDFEIRRTFEGRNSLLPIVKGRFIAQRVGTKVNVTFQPEPLVVKLTWLLLLATLIGSCNAAFGVLTREYPLSPALAMFPLGILAGWVAPRLLFWHEVRKQTRLLASIVSGERAASLTTHAEEDEGAERESSGVARAAYLIIVSTVPPSVAYLVDLPVNTVTLGVYAAIAVLYGSYAWMQSEKEMVDLVNHAVKRALLVGSFAFALYFGIEEGSLTGAMISMAFVFVLLPKAAIITAATTLASYVVYRAFVALGWLRGFDFDWNPLRRRRSTNG